MSEWISVKKYLPPLREDVLLYIPDVENTSEYNVGYLESDGDFYFNNIPDHIDVLNMESITHWMPLPEPPHE